jgi:hypothetical protein
VVVIKSEEILSFIHEYLGKPLVVEFFGFTIDRNHQESKIPRQKFRFSILFSLRGPAIPANIPGQKYLVIRTVNKQGRSAYNQTFHFKSWKRVYEWMQTLASSDFDPLLEDFTPTFFYRPPFSSRLVGCLTCAFPLTLVDGAHVPRAGKTNTHARTPSLTTSAPSHHVKATRQ